MLQDTGAQGTFDFTGTAGTDDPITTTAGQNVMETITVTAPSLNAEDNQAITKIKKSLFLL